MKDTVSGASTKRTAAVTAMMSTDTVSTVRAKSCVAVAVPRGEAGVDGHEGRREAGDDEDREDELGQRERGVVDVQFAPGAEGARERPVTDEAHDVARERERREQDGAARDERRKRSRRDVSRRWRSS